MGKKQCKKLSEMKAEEWGQPIEPTFEVKYKDLVFTAFKNSFYDNRTILSCYISRDGKLLEHSGRTQYFTEEKALEELKWKYKHYLQDEVIEILKEKALRKIVPPSDFNEPYIQIELGYEDISADQWEKVKEYFEL